MPKSSFFVAVLSAICSVVAWRPSLGFATFPTAVPQGEIGRDKELEVKISLSKPVLSAGEAVQLRVEIWNVGTQDVLICKDFLSWLCDLRLSFDPVAKVKHPAFAEDCVPYEWEAHAQSDQRESFASILVKDWVSISPRHFYGGTIELKPAFYPELREPAHYRISGRYSSGGLLEGRCYYKLRIFPSEAAQLPAKSWRGNVDSNSVVLHVIPKKGLTYPQSSHR